MMPLTLLGLDTVALSPADTADAAGTGHRGVAVGAGRNAAADRPRTGHRGVVSGASFNVAGVAAGIGCGVILVCVPELVQVTPAGVVGHGVTNCVLDEGATAQQIGGGCSVLSNCFPHCAWRQASL